MISHVNPFSTYADMATTSNKHTVNILCVCVEMANNNLKSKFWDRQNEVQGKVGQEWARTEPEP